MRKPNVEKILVKGSPKQRILLYIEGDIAEIYGQAPLLTEVELKRISESFKTDNEVRVWNKAMDYFRAIGKYLVYIEATRNEYHTKIQNLRGLCLLWIEYTREEETFNKILYSVKDKPTKDRIREIITKDRFILWPDAKTDEEGFIEFVIDKRKKRVKPAKDFNLIEEEVEGTNLLEVITLLGERARELLTQVKTMVHVVYSFMEKTYYIRGFRNMLKDLEEPLSDNQSPFPVFNNRFCIGEENIVGEALFGKDAQIMKEFRQGGFKDKEEIYSKYWVFPNYEELEIDQEFFNEQYEYFFKPVDGEK